MKRFKNILVLLGICVFVFICLCGKFNITCLFKRIFGISCPACGLTRSIRALLKLDIITSFKYNIFGPIVFVIFITLILFMIKDIIKNENKTIKYMSKYLGKYYYVVIICLIISMIINNIRGI